MFQLLLTICRVTRTRQYWFESRRNYVETYQKLINTTSEKNKNRAANFVERGGQKIT